LKGWSPIEPRRETEAVLQTVTVVLSLPYLINAKIHPSYVIVLEIFSFWCCIVYVGINLRLKKQARGRMHSRFQYNMQKNSYY